MGANELSWVESLVLSTAHVRALRPKVFPLLRDGTKDSVTPGAAMRQAFVFAGLWLLALAMLPLTWVAGAFLTWLIALTPGLLEIHRQFQNEKDVE